MKKILILTLLSISLSSCMMFPDKRSGQEIFYGEKLIETREIPKAKKANTSFIYNYEDDYKDEECIECQNENNY